MRKFVYGPGIDEPISLIDVANGNAVYYYHGDGLGSVVALCDVNSVPVERYAYDVFGRPTIRDVNGVQVSQSAFGNPYLFTARAYDAESGLYYYRARYYDHATARFLQPDPIGYAGGLNMYSYGDNNPTTLVDPFGLTPWGYVTGTDDYAFSRGVDRYLSDVTQSMIGLGEGLGDVGASTLNSVIHPVQTIKGTLYAIAHPVETLESMGTSLVCKGRQLFGDDPRAAGRVIGQGAGQAALAAVGGKVVKAAVRGTEIKIGSNLRVAPFGNRTGNPLGKWPHYHRRGINPATGEPLEGQGIGRHRPWEKKSTDTGFGDRF